MNILFIITSKYPFGKGDSFVENEMRFLATAFDKIVIISNECSDPLTKWIPENASIERLSYELTPIQNKLSLLSVISKSFWKELKCIKTVYQKPFDMLLLKTAFVSHTKSIIKGKQLLKIFRKYSSATDNVYAYSYWTNDMALALTCIKNKLPSNTKIFSRAHGWDVYFDANKAHYLPFRQKLFEELDKVFFISNKGFSYYKELFPALQHKMAISKLGVLDPGVLNPSESLPHAFTIVSCSHVLPIKRVYLIAEALSLVDTGQVFWVHFGDGALFSALQQTCTKLLDTKENITYHLPGNISNSEVLDFFKTTRVDVLVNVSSTEGIPVSMMEAMSFGVPVLATDVGGTHEIVCDGKNGFLLSANPSAEEIALALSKIIALPDSEIKSLRDKARKTWIDSYNSEQNYRTFVEDILLQ